MGSDTDDELSIHSNSVFRKLFPSQGSEKADTSENGDSDIVMSSVDAVEERNGEPHGQAGTWKRARDQVSPIKGMRNTRQRSAPEKETRLQGAESVEKQQHLTRQRRQKSARRREDPAIEYPEEEEEQETDVSHHEHEEEPASGCQNNNQISSPEKYTHPSSDR